MLKSNSKGVYKVFDKKLREETGETGGLQSRFKKSKTKNPKNKLITLFL